MCGREQQHIMKSRDRNSNSKIIAGTQRFSQGDVIRNIKSGHPYFVIYVSKVSTMVVDLESRAEQLIPAAILERNYMDYERDQDLSYIRDDGKSMAFKIATIL